MDNLRLKIEPRGSFLVFFVGGRILSHFRVKLPGASFPIYEIREISRVVKKTQIVSFVSRTSNLKKYPRWFFSLAYRVDRVSHTVRLTGGEDPSLEGALPPPPRGGEGGP